MTTMSPPLPFKVGDRIAYDNGRDPIRFGTVFNVHCRVKPYYSAAQAHIATGGLQSDIGEWRVGVNWEYHVATRRLSRWQDFKRQVPRSWRLADETDPPKTEAPK